MAQALQQSETAMAKAGSQGSQADQPQEMSGAEGFNADGTPKGRLGEQTCCRLG